MNVINRWYLSRGELAVYGVLGILALLTAGSFVWAIFLVGQETLDFTGVPGSTGRGVVIAKRFKPSDLQTTLVYVQSNNSFFPSITVLPEAWLLEVEVGGGRDSVSVPENVFKSLDLKSEVSVVYKIGRLTGRVGVQEVLASENVRQ